ncbi:MAG: ABC transporter permease [Planctomycetota bacterium]|jgi:lipooligosaccharide transport system permease protein|nr:ABC transporter permease [Planctomycetota bacterium]
MLPLHYRAAVHWQSRAVLLRHLRVYIRNWYTAFLPPAMEPVLFLLAFGLGLGVHVAGISHGGHEVSYASYIAPGMLAYTTFLTPFFQSLFGAFIRMHYQKTWEGQLTSQIALPHVIWGEQLWAALLATMYVTIVLAVIAICQSFGLVHLDLMRLLPVPLVSFVFALGFSALALLFTAILPTIDHMNLPVFLVALPLGFTSNTYFPMPTEHPAVAVLMYCNPLYHLAEGYRALALGGDGMTHLGIGAIQVTGLVIILVPIINRRLRRRVLGEG